MNYVSSDIPQANRLDLLVEVVVALNQARFSSEDIIEVIRRKTGKIYRLRQAGYYGDAGVCFGLLQATGAGYMRTHLGERLKQASQDGERAEVLREALLTTPIIIELEKTFLKQQSELCTSGSVANWLKNRSDLSESTVKRRASSLMRYLEFLSENGGTHA